MTGHNDEPAMELFRPFEYFDPLVDNVPQDWPRLYAEMVGRARVLISDWDRIQLERVADLWHYLLQQLYLASFEEAKERAQARGQVTVYKTPPSTVNAAAQQWGNIKSRRSDLLAPRRRHTHLVAVVRRSGADPRGHANCRQTTKSRNTAARSRRGRLTGFSTSPYRAGLLKTATACPQAGWQIASKKPVVGAMGRWAPPSSTA